MLQQRLPTSPLVRRVDNLEGKVSGLTDEVQQLPGPLRAVLGKFEDERESGGAGVGAVVTGTPSARGLLKEGPHNDGITPPAQHEGRSTRPGARLVVPRIPAGADPGIGPGSGEVMGSSSQEQPAAVGACIDYTAAEKIISSSRPVAEGEPVWAQRCSRRSRHWPKSQSNVLITSRRAVRR
ncbi:unnamed protein product [Ectocarpus sp. CCAP 1310/34]|nr:unnamed protein product [Ectocarpus sp. CCAP 1310/34]